LQNILKLVMKRRYTRVLIVRIPSALSLSYRRISSRITPN